MKMIDAVKGSKDYFWAKVESKLPSDQSWKMESSLFLQDNDRLEKDIDWIRRTYVRLVLEKVPYSDLVVRLALYPSKGPVPILVEYPSKDLLLFAYGIPRADDVALILGMVKDAEHQRDLYFDSIAREDMERTSAMEMARNAIDRCIDGLHKAHVTARLEGKKHILAALETWMKKMDSDDEGRSIKPTKPLEVGGKKK